LPSRKKKVFNPLAKPENGFTAKPVTTSFPHASQNPQSQQSTAHPVKNGSPTQVAMSDPGIRKLMETFDGRLIDVKPPDSDAKQK
jgi:hypothetical protein